MDVHPGDRGCCQRDSWLQSNHSAMAFGWWASHPWTSNDAISLCYEISVSASDESPKFQNGLIVARMAKFLWKKTLPKSPLRDIVIQNYATNINLEWFEAVDQNYLMKSYMNWHYFSDVKPSAMSVLKWATLTWISQTSSSSQSNAVWRTEEDIALLLGPGQVLHTIMRMGEDDGSGNGDRQTAAAHMNTRIVLMRGTYLAEGKRGTFRNIKGYFQ